MPICPADGALTSHHTREISYIFYQRMEEQSQSSDDMFILELESKYHQIL